jgi:transposase
VGHKHSSAAQNGMGKVKIARELGVGVSTVQRVAVA